MLLQRTCRTCELIQKTRKVNIDVENYEIGVENKQANTGKPDTELDLLDKSHPNGIDTKGELENKHLGAKEPYRKANFVNNSNTDVNDKNDRKLIGGMQQKKKGPEADPLKEAS